MTKKNTTLLGLVGMIGLMITTGVIGYVIGDCCGLDWELFGQMVLIYVPPIIGSVFTTLYITRKQEVQDDVKN